jgi:hypothetical protein
VRGADDTVVFGCASEQRAAEVDARGLLLEAELLEQPSVGVAPRPHHQLVERRRLRSGDLRPRSTPSPRRGVATRAALSSSGARRPSRRRPGPGSRGRSPHRRRARARSGRAPGGDRRARTPATHTACPPAWPSCRPAPDRCAGRRRARPAPGRGGRPARRRRPCGWGVWVVSCPASLSTSFGSRSNSTKPRRSTNRSEYLVVRAGLERQAFLAQPAHAFGEIA